MLNEDYNPRFSFDLPMTFAFHNTLLEHVRQPPSETRKAGEIVPEHGKRRYVKNIVYDNHLYLLAQSSIDWVREFVIDNGA